MKKSVRLLSGVVAVVAVVVAARFAYNLATLPPEMPSDLAGIFDQFDNSRENVQIPDDAIFIPSEGDITAAAKEAFILAESGDTIVFPEGTFNLTDTLTFDGSANNVDGLTIMGHGLKKTVLNFSTSANGDGMLIQNVKNVTIKHLTVTEAPNNAIKLKDTDGILIEWSGTIWEGELDKDNGAYGLYPVETSNVVVQDNLVRGSADAGVYVGQSDSIVVRRNLALENVAGIEIENSTRADVYDNVAARNTGGLLIFDLPIGNNKYGSGVRVFDNDIKDNNTHNFASVGQFSGGVHIVPPGTGVIVLSTSDVEIYKNTVTNHNTTAVAISSYFLADGNLKKNELAALEDGWNPVPQNIHIHSNELVDYGSKPSGSMVEELLKGYRLRHFFKDFPAILYDGVGALLANNGDLMDIGIDEIGAGEKICAANNGDAGVLLVYGTDPSFEKNWNKEGTDVAGIPPYLLERPQESLLACSDADEPAQVPVSTAVVNGVTFGCGADDATDPSSASCRL